MSETVVASQVAPADQFMANMNLIDALEGFARRGDRSVELEKFDKEALDQLLHDEAGRTISQKWLRSFNQSLVLLNEFRQAYLDGVEADEEDFTEVLEGSRRVIAALRRRLLGSD